MIADLRFGLIGAGRWGRTIIRTLRDMPNVALARLASGNPASAEIVPDDCIIESDWRKVALADDIDGLIIAAPAALHAEMTVTALEAGLPVFVEKPMATTLEDAQRLLDVVSARCGILQVDHIDLFNPAWRTLKISLPRIGKILDIEAIFAGPGAVGHDVSALWDWGPHPVALCADLLGVPDNVHATHRRIEEPGGECAENVEVLLGFNEGAHARITLSNATERLIRRMVVKGAQGALIYDDCAEDKLVFQSDRVRKSLPVVAGMPLTIALDRFCRAVCAAEPCFGDAGLGVSVVEVLAQADQELAL